MAFNLVYHHYLLIFFILKIVMYDAGPMLIPPPNTITVLSREFLMQNGIICMFTFLNGGHIVLHFLPCRYGPSDIVEPVLKEIPELPPLFLPPQVFLLVRDVIDSNFPTHRCSGRQIWMPLRRLLEIFGLMSFSCIQLRISCIFSSFVKSGAHIVELYGGVGTIGLNLGQIIAYNELYILVICVVDLVASLDCSDENPYNLACFLKSRNELPPLLKSQIFVFSDSNI
jgi:hypothetical protein